MAYTATKIFTTVHGTQRVIGFEVTADAASGAVATGLSYIDGISIAPISMATAGAKFKRNLNAASATANGTVFVSSAANADLFYLTVFGR